MLVINCNVKQLIPFPTHILKFALNITTTRRNPTKNALSTHWLGICQYSDYLSPHWSAHCQNCQVLGRSLFCPAAVYLYSSGNSPIMGWTGEALWHNCNWCLGFASSCDSWQKGRNMSWGCFHWQRCERPLWGFQAIYPCLKSWVREKTNWENNI